jgi:hypothetical protein
MLWGLSLSSVVPSGHLTLTAFGSERLTISFSVQGAGSNLGPLHCLLLDYFSAPRPGTRLLVLISGRANTNHQALVAHHVGAVRQVSHRRCCTDSK